MGSKMVGKRPHPLMHENFMILPDNPTTKQKAAIKKLTTKYGLKVKDAQVG